MKGELMNENSISGSNLRSTADGIRALISYGLDKNLMEQMTVSIHQIFSLTL